MKILEFIGNDEFLFRYGSKSKGSRLLCSDVFTFEGKSLIISHEIN
jgi:hypothetical protein